MDGATWEGIIWLIFLWYQSKYGDPPREKKKKDLGGGEVGCIIWSINKTSLNLNHLLKKRFI